MKFFNARILLSAAGVPCAFFEDPWISEILRSLTALSLPAGGGDGESENSDRSWLTADVSCTAGDGADAADAFFVAPDFGTGRVFFVAAALPAFVNAGFFPSDRASPFDSLFAFVCIAFLVILGGRLSGLALGGAGCSSLFANSSVVGGCSEGKRVCRVVPDFPTPPLMSISPTLCDAFFESALLDRVGFTSSSDFPSVSATGALGRVLFVFSFNACLVFCAAGGAFCAEGAARRRAIVNFAHYISASLNWQTLEKDL